MQKTRHRNYTVQRGAPPLPNRLNPACDPDFFWWLKMSSGD